MPEFFPRFAFGFALYLPRLKLFFYVFVWFKEIHNFTDKIATGFVMLFVLESFLEGRTQPLSLAGAVLLLRQAGHNNLVERQYDQTRVDIVPRICVFSGTISSFRDHYMPWWLCSSSSGPTWRMISPSPAIR
jgi:hypothetical protein